MLCDEVRELLYEYIYGELEEEKKIAVQEHMKNCSNCEKEYDELKVLLIDDMKAFSEAKDNISMPSDLPLKVKNKLFGTPIIRYSRFAAAACFLVFLFYAVPVVAYYAIENTALSKYIIFDKGLIQDMEKGRIQLVDKSATLKDITLRVDGIIKKSDRTTILLTAKVPEGMDIDYAYPSFNTITVMDQLGSTYRHMGSAGTLKSAKEDGEFTMILDVEPLKFWAYKLTLRVTALEVGILEKKAETSKEDKDQFNYTVKKEKDVYGSWEVDFYIDRSNRE